MKANHSGNRIRAAISWSVFLSHLELAQVECLQDAGTLHRCGKDECLYREGQEATDLWLLISGQVKLVKQCSKGRRLIVELLLPQAVFGGADPASARVHTCSAIAITETEALSFPMRCFREILDGNLNMQKALLSNTCERLCHAQQMWSLLLESSPHRIRRLLLYLYDQFGPEIPCTRAILAEMAGTSVETAIRVTRQLSQREFIATERGKIMILDPKKLAADIWWLGQANTRVAEKLRRR